MGIICRENAELDYDIAMATEEQTHRPSLLAPRAEAPSRHWAFTVLGIAIILGICYWAELVLAVMMVSALLAFILAPVVDLLMRLRLPRSVASAIAVLLLLAVMGGIVYFSYNQASALLQDLPKYAGTIREKMMSFRKQAESLEALNAEQDNVVHVRAAASWTDILTQGFGSAGQAVLAASFVPFLVYFMLTWQQHVRSATVMLFKLEDRHTAYVTLGLISAMIRTFMVGNMIVALVIGAASTLIFGLLHVPFFYFIGFISGFLSLVPYMGVLLAMTPPLFVSIGHISSESILYIVAAVLVLHVIAVNLLYPKFLGSRLQLNPLAVTMAALLWAWLWGAIGLILAIPITAAMKIVFDHVDSLKRYGVWLGE